MMVGVQVAGRAVSISRASCSHCPATRMKGSRTSSFDCAAASRASRARSRYHLARNNIGSPNLTVQLGDYFPLMRTLVGEGERATELTALNDGRRPGGRPRG